MHAQLEILLETQDLKAQRESLDHPAARKIEEGIFDLEPGAALVLLDEKIEELKARLDEPVRSRYASLARSYERAVAPVLNGICYGCFVAVPTAWATEADRNSSISVCDHCGRFLYYVD